MSDLERLKEAMGGIREADAGLDAPAHVETRLRAAFREQHAKRRRRPWFVWAAAATAAFILTAAGLWRITNPETVAAPPAPTASLRPQPSAPTLQSVEATTPVAPADAQHGNAAKPTRKARKATPVEPQPEIEFVALPFAPPFSPDDAGQVIRVRVPRQSIRSLGLPVNEDRMLDRVPAEILMGQDGIARGIRFVSASDVR